MEISFNDSWAAHLRIFDGRRRRHGKLRRAEYAVSREGVPGIDTPEAHASA